MANVLLISEKKYFIVSSLVRQLGDCGHDVTYRNSSANEMDVVWHDHIFIYGHPIHSIS